MSDLDPKAWKNLVKQFKIKDNGLEAALVDYDKLEDDAHDECLKVISKVSQLANTLRRAREVVAAREALDFITQLIRDAEKEKSEVAKLKATAEKAQEKADKAKAEADKAQAEADKAKAAAEKAEAKEKGDEDEDEDDDKDKGKGDDKGLKTLMKSMLMKVKSAKPDEPYHYLVCEAKPFPYLIIAKQINAGHRKFLEKASGGSKRFLRPNTVTFEDGHYCFSAQKDVPGMAKKIQGSLKNLLGKKYQVMFGSQKDSEDDDSVAPPEEGEEKEGRHGEHGEHGERGDRGGRGQGVEDSGEDTGETPEEQEGQPKESEEPALNMTAPFSISGSVGRGGKNKPEDVEAVQTALNRKTNAGLTVDGKCGPATIKAIMDFQKSLGKFKPDGLIEVGRGTARELANSGPMPKAPEAPNPVPPPKLGKGSLDKAPDAWRGMHGVLGRNIGELKKAVRSEYASEHPELLKAIEEAMKKLDGLMSNLGTELADHLSQAHAAKDEAQRKAKLQACKAMIAKHISYVKSEPLFAHMDKNPFGVAVNSVKILTDHLMHVAQAIGKV